MTQGSTALVLNVSTSYLSGNYALSSRSARLVERPPLLTSQGYQWRSSQLVPRTSSPRVAYSITNLPFQYESLYYTARPTGSSIPQYVVKVLDPATEEGPIPERLQVNPSSPNHGLPSEIIPSEPRLLVMPFVGDMGCIEHKNRPASFFLDMFYQTIEVRLPFPRVTCLDTNAETSTGRRVSASVADRTPSESIRWRLWRN